MAAVGGVLLLQGGLGQPQGILGQIILLVHHGVHPLHIVFRRGGQLQEGVPRLLVARIALPQAPGAGIAVLADLGVVEGQSGKTFFRRRAGIGKGLAALLRGLPHIVLEGAGLLFDGILHGVAGSVILQQGVEGLHGPLTHRRGNADRDQGHQQNGRKPPGGLCAQ